MRHVSFGAALGVVALVALAASFTLFDMSAADMVWAVPGLVAPSFDLKALTGQRADLRDEAQAIVAAAKRDERDLSDEEKKRADELFLEIERLDRDIKRAERFLELERVEQAVQDPNRIADEAARYANGGGEPGLHGFDNLADFALSVRNASVPGGRVDERLSAAQSALRAAPTNYHQEGGAAEGYMVPPAMRDQIWQLVFDGQDIINMLDLEPTMSNSVKIGKDEWTPWGGTGVTANWRAEGSQMSASKMDTDQITVELNQLYAFVLATEELLEDAPRLNSRLTRQAAGAIRYKASDSFVYGTGVGQPLGWFASGALVTVAKEGSQAADTIQQENVSKMFSRLLQGNISRAFWLANSDTLPQLMGMTIGDQPIWTPPSTGLRGAPGGILLGRPIELSEHAKTLGDKGDIQLVDPMGYYATQKQGGVKFATSIHLYFDYAIQAFRWTFRFGGQPYLSAPVSPDNGSNTKSHFITLAERA